MHKMIYYYERPTILTWILGSYRTILLFLVMVVAHAIFACSLTYAQNEEQIGRLKSDNELLKLQKERAELQRDITKAEKERITNMLPQSETKALEGKTTIDEKVFLESHVLAYSSISRVSDQIAQEVKDAKPNLTKI